MATFIMLDFKCKTIMWYGILCFDIRVSVAKKEIIIHIIIIEMTYT